MYFAYRIGATQERLLSSLTKLDLQVMRLLWAQGSRNARQLHVLLAGHYAADYTAVMASISRLVSAGLLAPQQPDSGLSYSYGPTISREEFVRLCGPQLVARLEESRAVPARETRLPSPAQGEGAGG